jgi:hypothetical protein
MCIKKYKCVKEDDIEVLAEKEEEIQPLLQILCRIIIQMERKILFYTFLRKK